MTAFRRVGVVIDVGPPPRGDKLKWRFLGEDTPSFGVELTEQVHGPDQGRIAAGVKRKSIDELGGELAEVAVTALQEVEIVVVEGPDDPVGLLDGVPEFIRGDAAVDGSSQVRILDLGIENHPTDLAEELDLLVRRAGDREPEVLQVATGPVVGLREAAVEQVERLIGQVDQGLEEEGDEDRVTPLLGHPLEGLVRGPTSDLGQELQAVRGQRRYVPAVDTPLPAAGPLLQGGEDHRRRVCRGGLLEPGQAGAPGVGVDSQQAVEPGLAVPGQDRAQPSVGLLLGPLSGRGDDAFQVGDPRPLDPEAQEMFASQAQQQGWTVMLEGAVHEPAFELGQVSGRGLVEAEVTPDLPEVFRPRLAASAIPPQIARSDVELLRHERDDRLGDGAQVVRAEAQEAERAELEGEPETVGGRSGAWDLSMVRTGQGEVGLDVAGDDLGGEVVEPLAFRLGEEPDGHGGLLRGALAPVFSQTKGSERPRRLKAGDGKTRAFRFSESVLGMNSRQCTATMGFEKAGGRVPMRIGYARVSTDEQSLDLQLDALKKAGCRRVFTDKASAVNGDRPGLADVASHLRSGDVLVIWKLDRLGRTVKGLVEFVSDLQDRGVQFRSLTDGIDTTTPAGRFFFHVMASLAQMERELMAERTRAGLDAARRRGRVGGRKRRMTPGKVESARKLLKGGMAPRDVAQSLGVSVPTLYRWVPASSR